MCLSFTALGPFLLKAVDHVYHDSTHIGHVFFYRESVAYN